VSDKTGSGPIARDDGGPLASPDSANTITDILHTTRHEAQHDQDRSKRRRVATEREIALFGAVREHRLRIAGRTAKPLSKNYFSKKDARLPISAKTETNFSTSLPILVHESTRSRRAAIF
jgi:hypothetical protein